MENQRAATNSRMKVSKRAPLKAATTKSDIYVKVSSPLSAQLVRLEGLFKNSSRDTFVTVHGLGRAVGKAVELALVFKRECEKENKLVSLQVSTTTNDLFDDVYNDDIATEEDLDQEQAFTRHRLNSSIHIKITMTK